MKKATATGIMASTVFYLLCGVLGYAAFGNDAPGNFLTGFGFYDPFWLIDIANICIVIHLLGAYQVNTFSNNTRLSQMVINLIVFLQSLFPGIGTTIFWVC